MPYRAVLPSVRGMKQRIDRMAPFALVAVDLNRGEIRWTKTLGGNARDVAIHGAAGERSGAPSGGELPPARMLPSG